MTHGPSVRRLLFTLLGTFGVLVAALIVVTTLQLRSSDRQADAETRRAESFLLADSMRQSSNDLTQMVRLHVATGEARYREYYDEILAIRSGEAPRPIGYDSSFWDRVLAEGDGFVEYGPPESLVDQMRAVDFEAAEFDALSAALAASDDLARVEVDVMERVAGRIAQGVDDTYATDVSPQYRRLVDDAYLEEKGVIMAAIVDFIDRVDRRALAQVEDARQAGRVLLGVQVAILAGMVLVGARALIVARRRMITPLETLTATTRRIADGGYDERATDVHGVSELQHVAGAFNEMATAIESDIARREAAERVAVDARRAAEEASLAKSSFLATMSHEIRTPMIGVTGMLEVLAQSDLTPQQRQMVGTAQSSAAALIQLIGDTLDFSKIEAGKLEIAPETFAVRDVVTAAAATFLHTASAKNLPIATELDDALAPAHVGDSLRVRQILSNFLSNAVKFTEVGGIVVRARVLEDAAAVQTVAFEVVDTGIGLSPEQQERLFGEYSQADASTARQFGGTGLGLVICRRLAVLMGGEVALTSESGAGTTAKLVLPLPVGDSADIAPEASFTSTRYATSRPLPTREEAIDERSLVLVAEDHSVNRSVILHQLEAIGFRADAAEDGAAALDLFRSGRYAMVVTDLHMPRLDGYGLAEAIRRHEDASGWPRTPIMALTANVMQGEPERCRAAGMDDFGSKPTSIPVLAAKLREWLPHIDFALVEEDEPAGAAAPTGPIDPAVLDELTGGDAELTGAVLRDYVESTSADLDALSAAVAGGDADAARRHAHRIKGASLTVGAAAVATAATRLEEAAAAGHDTELAGLSDALHHASADVADHLSRAAAGSDT